MKNERRDFICEAGCRHTEDPARGIALRIIPLRPVGKVQLLLRLAMPEGHNADAITRSTTSVTSPRFCPSFCRNRSRAQM